MGTRSLVTFIEDGSVLVSVYRQFDGCLEGRGKQLAEFLSGIVMRNGFGTDDKAGTHANGMGCLAAQWIEHEKDGQMGNVYISLPTKDPDPDDIWIEYFYKVELQDDGGISINVDGFKGSPEALLKHINAT